MLPPQRPMASSPIHTSPVICRPLSPTVKLAIVVGVFGFVALLNHNAVVNQFVVVGADSDTLWHTGLLWRGDAQLTNPPGIDNRSYFNTHFAPFFILPALASHFLPFDAMGWYALFMGVCHGASAAIFAFCALTFAERRGAVPILTAMLGALAGVAFAFTPVAAQMARYPHYEVAIPGLILATAAALALGRTGMAAVPFVLALSFKQDTGLHAALLFATIAGATWIRTRRFAWPELSFAAIGTAYAIFGFLFAPLFMPSYQGHMVGYFVGDPPFGHWRLDEIARKVDFFAWQSAHVWAPLLLMAAVATLRRDLALAVGTLAVTPWFVLVVCFANFITVWALGFHYPFPALIAYGWPTILALYRLGPRHFAGDTRFLALLQIAVLALAFVPKLGTQFPPGYSRPRFANIHYHVTPEAQAIARHRDFVQALHDGYPQLGRVRAAIAVTAMAPRVIDRNEWIEEIKRPDDPAIGLIDTILFLDAAMACPEVERVIRTARLPFEYRVPGTRIVVLSRRTLAQMPILAPHLVAAIRTRPEHCGLRELKMQ